jgi:CelD/BcsL family acetyltransferase involved in cellulose biosynthesis
VTLEVTLVEDVAAIPLSGSEWNALVAANETNTIFQTFEWFGAWWRSFSAGNSLFFLVVRGDGRIIGFAPLMIRRRFAGLKQLQFVGSGNADYQDFVLPVDKPRALRAICEYLHVHARNWDRIFLSNVPQHSSTVRGLIQCARSPDLRFVEEARTACPTLLLGESTRQLLRKYSIRRPHNWFARHGELGFRHISDRTELEAVLPSYFDQHVRRWRFKGVKSLFEDARQRWFYQQLVASLASTGWLLFSVAEFDGVPIAYHFGFDYAGRVIWYKPSFEVRFANRSPGLLLIGLLIEDALKRERREVDFTIGDEQFKSRFANVERANVNLSLYRPGFAYVAGTAARGLRRVGRAIRRGVANALGRT